MAGKILPHERPNRSRLEQWLADITRMRELHWPYARIARWLQEEQDFRVSREAVRQFCVRRGILKGRVTAVAAQEAMRVRSVSFRNASQGPRSAKDGTSSSKSPPVFQYDDSRPIDRWGSSNHPEGGAS